MEAQHVWTVVSWKTFEADGSVSGLRSAWWTLIQCICLFVYLCAILAFFFFLSFFFKFSMNGKSDSHSIWNSWKSSQEKVNRRSYCSWYNNNRSCNTSLMDFRLPLLLHGKEFSRREVFKKNESELFLFVSPGESHFSFNCSSPVKIK